MYFMWIEDVIWLYQLLSFLLVFLIWYCCHSIFFFSVLSLCPCANHESHLFDCILTCFLNTILACLLELEKRYGLYEYYFPNAMLAFLIMFSECLYEYYFPINHIRYRLVLIIASTFVTKAFLFIYFCANRHIYSNPLVNGKFFTIFFIVFSF